MGLVGSLAGWKGQSHRVDPGEKVVRVGFAKELFIRKEYTTTTLI
jgi:hypothetical protein